MKRLFSFHLRDRIGFWISTNPLPRWLFHTGQVHIYNPSLTRTIISHYDGDSGHQTDRKTGNLGFGFIHYGLIINMKPKRILCVGSRKGFIPAICALACIENGKGHVDFVDAGYDPNDSNHWSGVGWWKQIDPHKHFSHLDINKRLTIYIMTTEKFAKQYRENYDYIYIDGDHSYAGATRDWQLFWPRLRRGGLMIYHDVEVRHTKQLGIFGVWKMWRERAQKQGITFSFPTESGLGIIQKH